MDNEIQISKLEKVLVNSCTPILYGVTFGKISFKKIAEIKEDDYKRLAKYIDNNEKIPFSVQGVYHFTICGNIAVGTAYLRKYIKKYSKPTKQTNL